MHLFDKNHFPSKFLSEQGLTSVILGFVSLIALSFFAYTPHSPNLIIGCTAGFYLVAISTTLSRLLPDSLPSAFSAVYLSFLPVFMLVGLSWISAYFLDENLTIVWILLSALVLTLFIWLLFKVVPDPGYEGSSAQSLYLLGASLSSLILFLFLGVSKMGGAREILLAGFVGFSYAGILLQVQFRERTSILVASILVGLLVAEVSILSTYLPFSSIEVGFLLFLFFSCVSAVAAALIARKFRALSIKWFLPLFIFTASIFWLFLYL